MTLKTPAIFYAPHQDDEALGMGGAIIEHVNVGRPVFVVLLTDGQPSTWLKGVINGDTRCTQWHNVRHDFGLTDDQMIQARNREFFASCDALGVHRVFLADGGGIPHSDLVTMTTQIEAIIRDFEGRYPGSSHKLISGLREGADGDRHVAHWASFNAAMNIYNDAKGTKDFRFYRVREYQTNSTGDPADNVKRLTPAQRLGKARSLNCYRLFDPAIGRFGVGNHSVAGLIENALKDSNEYIDYPWTAASNP